MSGSQVVIVGAGLSGLAAARRIVAAGHRAVVFEKSRGLGGRIATRRVHGMPVDHGCPFLEVAPSSGLADVVEGLSADATVAVAGAPGRAMPAGMTTLAKSLARGLEIRRNVLVAALALNGNRVEVFDDQGEHLHSTEAGVIVSAPGPQSAALLESVGDTRRAKAMSRVEYESALVVLAGFAGARAEPVVMGSGVFARVVRENAKTRGEREVVFAAELTSERSEELFDESDDAIEAAVMAALMDAVGAEGAPLWCHVKRWRYARPRGSLLAEQAALSSIPIALCGDALVGADLSAVYDTGRSAADRILLAVS